MEWLQTVLEFLAELKWPLFLGWLMHRFGRDLVSTLTRAVGTLANRVARVNIKDRTADFAPLPSPDELTGAVQSVVDTDAVPVADRGPEDVPAGELSPVPDRAEDLISIDQGAMAVQMAIAVGEVSPSQLEFLKELNVAGDVSDDQMKEAYRAHRQAYEALGMPVALSLDDWWGWMKSFGFVSTTREDLAEQRRHAVTPKGRVFLNFLARLYPKRFANPRQYPHP